MDRQLSQDILTFLALSVLIDGKVRDAEITAFADSVENLNNRLHPRFHQSREDAHIWFLDNRQRLSARLEDDPEDDFLWGVVFRLEHFPYKEELLAAIMNIAQSDDEYHRSEQHLVTLSAKAWDLRIVQPVG